MIKISNWNIIEKDLNKDDPDEIANLLKNDVTMAIFMIKDHTENKRISKIYQKSLVSEFYNSTGNISSHMNYKDRKEVYRKGLCDIIEGNKGPAYFPVALSCGNMDNDDVEPEIKLLTNDRGMIYDTSTKEYIVGNYGSSYNGNVMNRFSYSEEQFKEYGEKIKQKREKKKQRIEECKEKIKELISQNKNVDEITKIIRESYKELDIRRSDIEYYAQNKA